MVSEERAFATYKACRHVCLNAIPGDFVECGIYRSGMGILAALTFERYSKVKRRVVLFDTFAGMTRPTHEECDREGQTAEAALIVQPDMCLATIEEVQTNVRSFDFKLCEFRFVKSGVCETLLTPENIPPLIAVLRLDTDWYESTRLELEVLYPCLRRHGICLIDDYGHWLGARKAVDEFTQNAVPPIYLTRTDSTGVEFVRP